MAIWALGRLPTKQTIRKAQDVLINALQDQYFKVRAAACTAIAQIGAECQGS
jgi:HEAT repeat protein